MKVAGMGFRKDAPEAALRDALARAEEIGGPVETIAVPREKADAPVLAALAARLGLGVIAVDVEGIPTPTRSERVLQRFGTGSVAEAAALAAAGEGGTLLVSRRVSGDGQATAAIALGGAGGPNDKMGDLN